MRISLIVATIHRKKELELFLSCLLKQDYDDLEVIVVDQNPNGYLDDIIKKYSQQLNIIHLKSEKGLSKARNVGLKVITGDVVAFPDDDCIYKDGLLRKLSKTFEENPQIDGFIGVSVDHDGKRNMMKGELNGVEITPKNALWTVVSYTIFLNRRVVDRTGDFNESLGVGANTIWGSGEETDYIIRVLKKGFKLIYRSDLKIYHPTVKSSPDRIKKYGMGSGFIYRQHFKFYQFVWYGIIRPLVGSAIDFLLGNKENAYQRYLGIEARINGWIKSGRSLKESDL